MPTPEEKVAEEFDLPDHHFDPELDLPPGAMSPPPAVPPEPPVQAPEAPVTPPRDDKGKFQKPAYLVRMAQSFGVSDADIQGLSGEALAAVVEQLHRQSLQMRHDNARFTQQYQAQQQQAPQAPPGPPPLNLDEEVHPAIAAALRTVHDTANQAQARAQQLEAQLHRQQQLEGYRQQQTLVDQIDTFFAGLGPQGEKLFGKGPGHTLSPSGEEKQRRLAVLLAAQQFQGQPGGVHQHLRLAHQVLFGAQPESQIDPAAVERWNQGGVAHPTSRRAAPEPKGKARAMHAVSQLLREKGQLRDDGTSTEEFNLPD